MDTSTWLLVCLQTDRFGRDSFESMSDTLAVVPRPVRSDEAVQGLMLTYAFNQRMSGCLVVAALHIEG